MFVGSSPGVDDHDSLRRSGGKTTADHSGTEPSCDIRHVSYSTRVIQITLNTVHVCLCEFFARPAVAWWCVVNVLISCRCKIYHLAPMFANYWPGPAVAWPAAAQRQPAFIIWLSSVQRSSRSPAPRDGDRRTRGSAATLQLVWAASHPLATLAQPAFGLCKFCSFTPAGNVPSKIIAK